MGIIKKIIIIIGAILYTSLIIHSLPQEYSCEQKEISLFSSQDNRQCLLSEKELKEITDAHFVRTTGIIPIFKESVFDISKFSFSNVNPTVYHWQLPRGNVIPSHLFRFIGYIIGYNANISLEHISH